VIIQEYASRSVNNLRILFDLDITQLNSQWVNAGAGVWWLNVDAIYPTVDPSLLVGFTAQTIPAVGSVNVDSTQLAEASTLLECSNNNETFYWDGANLYIHLSDGGSPYLHQITIGVVFGYSREGFTPVDSTVFYESRLLGVPRISKARDPLFYGKLQYEGGSVELNNGDGGLDTIGEDNNAYGNQARVSMGFADQSINDYQRVFTGFVETLSVDERGVTIAFKDKRKQLSKKILYTCTALNALEAIEEILLDNYSIPYNGLYFDTAIWEAEKPKALNVTIDLQREEPAIDVIQKICESTFGLFVVNVDGKYSFRVVRPGDAATYIIPDYDIINSPRAVYDPSEVITSTRVGYARDWTTTGSAYTYLNDTSQEADIYARYKTYNERTFETYLPDLTSAQTFSDAVLGRSGTIRPTFELEVPIKYYAIDVGDFAEIAINRPNATWFGERKCEIIGKSYNLDRGTITLIAKKYGNEIAYRITTDGLSRFTTDGAIRKVGA
jgi:hypothetical protein